MMAGKPKCIYQEKMHNIMMKMIHFHMPISAALVVMLIVIAENMRKKKADAQPATGWPKLKSYCPHLT